MSHFEDCLYFFANLLARRLNSIAAEAFKSMDITAAVIPYGYEEIHPKTASCKSVDE